MLDMSLRLCLCMYVNHALIGRVDEGLGSDTHRSIGSVLNIHESVYLNLRRWRGDLHFLLVLHGVCLQSCLLFALRTPVLCKCRDLRSPAKAPLSDQLAGRQINHKMKENFELRDCETDTTIALFFSLLPRSACSNKHRNPPNSVNPEWIQCHMAAER